MAPSRPRTAAAGGARAVDAERVGPDGRRGEADEVAVEEPLEIRISGETLAVTMRTPGNDRELVLGFLLAEGVIASAADVSTVVHCGRSDDAARDNTIDVTLAPGVRPPIDEETGMLARRGTLTTSACGVCGRRSIEDLLARAAPLPTGGGVPARVLLDGAASLRERQPLFARTGGCHAASLLAFDGAPVATFEDVGRHNAVDKVVGARLLAGEAALPDRVLLVSGRASFEIVQKALAARIPVVASVSAPSSLAVELARAGNVTLAAFVRGAGMTLYANGSRVT
jgi:FdhD protein